LAGLNAWLLTRVLHDAPERAPDVVTPVVAPKAAASPATSRRHLPRPKPIAAYQSLAKPVFVRTRAPYVPRPAAPPPVKPKAAAPPPPVDSGLVLGGIVVVEQAKKAYIFRKADQRGGWLSEGETILGWNVESIDAAAPRLRQVDRLIELHLSSAQALRAWGEGDARPSRQSGHSAWALQECRRSLPGTTIHA
jgi:hypothetical protein